MRYQSLSQVKAKVANPEWSASRKAEKNGQYTKGIVAKLSSRVASRQFGTKFANTSRAGRHRPQFRGVSPDWNTRKSSGPVIQAQMTVMPERNKYEREADEIAQKVVKASPLTGKTNLNFGEPSQSANGMGETKAVRPNHAVTQIASSTGIPIPPPIASALKRARTRGRAIDKRMRASMETHLGTDYSRVQIHDDAQADYMNTMLGSRAFTTGKDIFFRHGEYRPGTYRGRTLLAHELTHVTQQGGALPKRAEYDAASAEGDRGTKRSERKASRAGGDTPRMIQRQKVTLGSLLGNALIGPQILSNLPVEALKNLRLVSKGMRAALAKGFNESRVPWLGNDRILRERYQTLTAGGERKQQNIIGNGLPKTHENIIAVPNNPSLIRTTSKAGTYQVDSDNLAKQMRQKNETLKEALLKTYTTKQSTNIVSCGITVVYEDPARKPATRQAKATNPPGTTDSVDLKTEHKEVTRRWNSGKQQYFLAGEFKAQDPGGKAETWGKYIDGWFTKVAENKELQTLLPKVVKRGKTPLTTKKGNAQQLAHSEVAMASDPNLGDHLDAILKKIKALIGTKERKIRAAVLMFDSYPNSVCPYVCSEALQYVHMSFIRALGRHIRQQSPTKQVRIANSIAVDSETRSRKVFAKKKEWGKLLQINNSSDSGPRLLIRPIGGVANMAIVPTEGIPDKVSRNKKRKNTNTPGIDLNFIENLKTAKDEEISLLHAQMFGPRQIGVIQKRTQLIDLLEALMKKAAAGTKKHKGNR